MPWLLLMGQPHSTAFGDIVLQDSKEQPGHGIDGAAATLGLHSVGSFQPDCSLFIQAAHINSVVGNRNTQAQNTVGKN
jgi:hypothetical protein